MGVMSRACIGCYEAYEQWVGFDPAPSSSTNSTVRGAFGSVSDGQITTDSKAAGSLPHENTGKSEGLSSEALGRDDIVRLPKSASDNIAIKTKPVPDTTVMPMPSVPHDWSWSTF
ncbi:hypothetical protein BGZ54_004792 [Gamsiella multidivaricata]|nr:hypothetical protein BGZ54_004792 [Gamsiella multidivaricata]